MTPAHILKIKESLENDEITWHQALIDLQHHAVSKKPWQYKERKETRSKIIKDSCEQCGASDGIMVLQHLSHPRKHQFIIEQLAHDEIQKHKALVAKKFDQFIKSNTEIKAIEKSPRNCCPSCDSTNIKFKKTTDKWHCHSTKSRNGRVIWHCKSEFTTPSTVMEFSKEAIEKRQRIESSFFSKFKNSKAKILDGYGKEAVLISIAESEHYYSCEDAVTFCKKCAYVMDQKSLYMCPICKKFTLLGICPCNGNNVSQFFRR
jgi:rubrerythrin